MRPCGFCGADAGAAADGTTCTRCGTVVAACARCVETWRADYKAITAIAGSLFASLLSRHRCA